MHTSTLNTSTLAIGGDWGNVRAGVCLSAAQQNTGIQSAQGSIRVAPESLAMGTISDDKIREIKTAVVVFMKMCFGPHCVSVRGSF